MMMMTVHTTLGIKEIDFLIALIRVIGYGIANDVYGVGNDVLFYERIVLIKRCCTPHVTRGTLLSFITQSL